MVPEPSLTNDEVLRYSRHLILPQVGPEGQLRLKASRVLVVGAGGLGSPAALYLAAAGVGTLGLVDDDVVDLANLHRQVLHGTGAVGQPKVESATRRLRDLNPHVALEPVHERLSSANAREIVERFDVVVDGSDNFPTRYLVNDACVLSQRPYAYGAIFRFDGQVSVFGAPDGPCYRCLFREPPPPGLVPSCDEAGVLGVLPGVIGSLQALEAIKLIVGAGQPLVGRLVLFDALRVEFRELSLRKDPDCPVCGEHRTVRALIDYEAFCGIGGAAPEPGAEITVEQLARERGRSDLVLIDVREPLEWEICHLDDAMLIPLGQLPQRLDEVPRDADVITICHHGNRSLRAVGLLREAGFERVRSLAGGLEAWAQRVDPGMLRY